MPALLLALMAALPVRSAERPWRRLEAEHYVVISQLSDQQTVNWTRQFDQFIAAVSTLQRIDLSHLPPLTVVLFAREQDFEPYKLVRPNGRSANVVGQFERRETWSVIGLPGDDFNAELRRTILHEATHWLMSVDESRQPAWYKEGTAELLSTFEYYGKNVNWAKPIKDHLYTLQHIGLISLRDFLAQPGALFDDDDVTGIFYAQAWAFTHFFMLSNDAPRQRSIARFLEAYKTQSGDAAIDAAFGDTLPDLEKAFRNYVSSGPFQKYRVGPASPTKDLPATTAASAESVQAALGFLALGADRKELARDHARRAIELDPQAAGGHELLAYLGMDGDAIDRAAVEAQEAVDKGSRDRTMYMLLASSFANGANANRPDAERQRVNLYEKVVDLNPRRRESYDRLNEALINLDNPDANDAKLLSQGLGIFATDDWLRVGAAAVAFRQDARAEAREAMNRALSPTSTLSDSQRKFAGGFLHSLWTQALSDDLQAALDRKDTDAARSIAGQLLEVPDLSQSMRLYATRVRDTPAANENPPKKPVPTKKPQKK